MASNPNNPRGNELTSIEKAIAELEMLSSMASNPNNPRENELKCVEKIIAELEKNKKKMEMLKSRVEKLLKEAILKQEKDIDMSPECETLVAEIKDLQDDIKKLLKQLDEAYRRKRELDDLLIAAMFENEKLKEMFASSKQASHSKPTKKDENK